MKIQNFKRSLFAVIFGLFFIIPIIPIISANQDIKNSAIVPYNSQWLTNSNFDTASNWVFTLDSDSPLDDIEDSITEGKANMKVIGESYSERVTLNSTTYTQWESFNKTSLVILPDDGFGVDQYGAWCSHTWHEDEGEQPENTPRIHWRYNVSLPVDMSDYQITSASLVAEINASVDLNIDCPGDLEARNGVNINQYEIYDWAQFYIEVSTQDIDEINTYRIAFNQTFDLGEGDPLGPDSTLNGFIQTKGEQAIIDAITNVLIADPEHKDFVVIIGIYMYCEDNNSGTDQDDWDSLRFKNLDLYFTYDRIIDKSATLTLSQTGGSLIGENVTIDHAFLSFDYELDQNWTDNSEFSELRIFINNNKYTQTFRLSDYDISDNIIYVSGLDLGNIIPKDVPITLSIQLYIANTFNLNHNITLSLDNVYLHLYWKQVGSETNIFREPWFATLLAILVTIGLVSLAGGFLYYYRVGRFPIPVRKVRKYRKSLTKESPPKDIRILPRDQAFKDKFADNTKVIHKDMKDRSLGKKIKQSVLLGEYNKFLDGSSGNISAGTVATGAGVATAIEGKQSQDNINMGQKDTTKVQEVKDVSKVTKRESTKKPKELEKKEK